MITTVGIAQNSVENPGFESWTGAQPDSWIFNSQTMVLTQNTAAYHGGVSSCDVLFNSQDQATVNLQSNTFSVAPGQLLTFGAWFIDNDVAGRATISLIYDNATYYPGIYTEDGTDWQELTITHTVPDGATTVFFQIRFYDVSTSWDGDCLITVDDAFCGSDNTVYPEPSNYPTNFSAEPSGVSANVSWTDATGDQLPQKYLVLASTSSSFTAPVDGTPVDDDNDMSDGMAALNVNFGDESVSFTGLSAATTYYFTIFPYTNSGDLIDYKTDGTAPAASVTMPDVSVISAVDFEDDTFGDWVAVSVAGDQVWAISSYGNPGNCAVMSGYDGQSYANEDWFISPSINLDAYSQEVFSFDNSTKYDGPALELYVSSDYSGDPATATWTMIDYNMSAGNWAYASSEIDLSSYTGTINLGFKFTSTDALSATWELDNLLITGTMENAVNEVDNAIVRVYPNPGTGYYLVSNPKNQQLNVAIYNILGQAVTETQSSSAEISFDITKEENGIYLVQITGDNYNKTISVIKR